MFVKNSEFQNNSKISFKKWLFLSTFSVPQKIPEQFQDFSNCWPPCKYKRQVFSSRKFIFHFKTSSKQEYKPYAVSVPFLPPPYNCEVSLSDFLLIVVEVNVMFSLNAFTWAVTLAGYLHTSHDLWHCKKYFYSGVW